jgi:hypothetical protein
MTVTGSTAGDGALSVSDRAIRRVARREAFAGNDHDVTLRVLPGLRVRSLAFRA